MHPGHSDKFQDIQTHVKMLMDLLPGLNQGMQQEVLTVLPYSMQNIRTHLVDQWAVYAARDQTEAWERPCDADRIVGGEN